MKINIQEIREGKLNGQLVWVCDYRHNHSVTDKPIRHIKPTQVMICPNSTITKTIYYSASHFQELDKNGNPNPKKIIGTQVHLFKCLIKRRSVTKCSTNR